LLIPDVIKKDIKPKIRVNCIYSFHSDKPTSFCFVSLIKRVKLKIGIRNREIDEPPNNPNINLMFWCDVQKPKYEPIDSKINAISKIMESMDIFRTGNFFRWQRHKIN